MSVRETHRHDSRRRRSDSGAVLVEMALILPVLVMLLIGIVQFGLAYSADVSVHGAAREGARCLALGQTDCTVASAVNGAKGSAENVTYQVVHACPIGASAATAEYATLSVNATYTFSIPFVSLGTKNISATASMRCGL